jgi:hypothetical protein
MENGVETDVNGGAVRTRFGGYLRCGRIVAHYVRSILCVHWYTYDYRAPMTSLQVFFWARGGGSEEGGGRVPEVLLRPSALVGRYLG